MAGNALARLWVRSSMRSFHVTIGVVAVASQVIEAMYRPVPSDANGQLAEGCLRDVTWTDYDLIVAGNGMGC